MIIVSVIIESFLPWGCLYNNFYLGGSVANARAANVSIIKLTHKSYVADKIGYLIMSDERTVVITATPLTVN